MKKKIALMATSLVLVVAMAVGGTLAYLTDKSETVTNTFTVGDVEITLTESTGETYHVYPGETYTKDPVITVADDSEDCWVFVKLTNNITGMEDEDDTIAAQMTANGWTLVDETNNVYGFEEICSAGESAAVFNHVTIAEDITADEIAAFNNATVELVGYAIQATGFNSAQEAWTGAGAEALANT